LPTIGYLLEQGLLMEKKVSMKDIAREVGVSTALVSFVLNGKEKEKRVGAEVAARILKVAADLHYKPNQIARSLRKGSTMTIGMIVADIANPFFCQMARVVEDEANKSGYTVIFGSSDESSVKSSALIDTLMNRQVDGFIIVPAEGAEEQIRNLLQQKIPVVLVDRYFPGISTSYVVLDNYRASYEAVSHLISKGYKRIAMLAYRSSLIHMKERVSGYVDRMKEQHLDAYITVKEIRYSHLQQDIGNAMHDLAVKNKKADAVLFATNALSIAGLYYMIKNGIKVPDDLAVLSFDASESFDFFYAPVTYVEQPVEELAKESVKVLVDLMHGSDKTTLVKLKHQLVKQKSCG